MVGPGEFIAGAETDHRHPRRGEYGDAAVVHDAGTVEFLPETPEVFEIAAGVRRGLPEEFPQAAEVFFGEMDGEIHGAEESRAPVKASVKDGHATRETLGSAGGSTSA